MHHTLRLYSENRKGILRVYMFFAKWAKIPVIGHIVRYFANAYGRSQHHGYLLTPAEAKELVALAGGLASAPCTCRTVFKKCKHPRDNEILLVASRHILEETKSSDAHEITPEKALEILQDSQRRGLVLTVMKCRGDFYAICSCCSCCCVPLRLSRQYGIGEVLVRHKNIVKEFREYVAAVNAAENH